MSCINYSDDFHEKHFMEEEKVSILFIYLIYIFIDIEPLESNNPRILSLLLTLKNLARFEDVCLFTFLKLKLKNEYFEETS